MELIMRDMRTSYVYLVEYLKEYGLPVNVRDQETLELTNATLLFSSSMSDMLPIGVGRNVNTKLAAVEALQLISGKSRYDLVEAAASNFSDVLVAKDDPDYGAYGPRAITQIHECIDLLQHDPTTRQAIVQIWNAHDLVHVGDKPCTVFLQFLIRDERLELHTYMRSNDVWLGLAYDVFVFTQLLHTVAHQLDVNAGMYIHHATSLHLYARNFGATANLHEPEDVDHKGFLPHGIVADDDEDFSDVAYAILDGYASPANHWYVKKISELELGTLRPT